MITTSLGDVSKTRMKNNSNKNKQPISTFIRDLSRTIHSIFSHPRYKRE
ncbi:MAG TPA: hypothetical protein VH500_23880 [Nitrososphaeraceae archaeon]